MSPGASHSRRSCRRIWQGEVAPDPQQMCAASTSTDDHLTQCECSAGWVWPEQGCAPRQAGQSSEMRALASSGLGHAMRCSAGWQSASAGKWYARRQVSAWQSRESLQAWHNQASASLLAPGQPRICPHRGRLSHAGQCRRRHPLPVGG